MSDVIRREIGRALASVRSALRGVLASVNKTAKVQLVDLEAMSGEQLKAMELFQHFGFTSAPPAGAQIIVLPLGGRTSAAVVVASEHGTFRFQLGADGEACVYNQWGDRIHLRQDRTIHVVSQAKVLIETAQLEIHATTSVAITTPQMTVTASTGVTMTTPLVSASTAVSAGTTVAAGTAITAGTSIDAGTNITAAGQVADSGGDKTMSGMRATFNTHTHPENNSPTNVTGATTTQM